MSSQFLCGRFEFALERPLVMGIVNVTPDSFSDGGRYAQHEQALRHAHTLIEQGADILDIGGESTRPGAPAVSLEEESARVLPLLHALRDAGVALSVDTSKPSLMRAALDVGADLINDVQALQQPGAIDAVRDRDCGLCIMHMQGEPRTMQLAPHYDNVVADVAAFLSQRAQALVASGVDARRIVLDPGFGFGKTVAQNYTLLRELPALHAQGLPILIGLSRKSMIGHVVGRDVDQRLPGSLAAMLACVARGAAIVRVHDVAETVDALRVWRAIEQAELGV